MARPASDIDLRIVHAARERFLLEGVDGASLRDIAKDAGTSIGMVYYYFPVKDDLFQAVVEEVYALLLKDLEVALAPDAPVQERMLRAYKRMGAMSEVEFTVVRLILREAMISSTRLTRIAQMFSRGHIPLLIRMLSDGLTAGDFTDRAHPVAIAATIASAGVLPQIVRRLVDNLIPRGMDVPKGPALGEMLADLVFRGVCGPNALPARKTGNGGARKRTRRYTPGDEIRRNAPSPPSSRLRRGRGVRRRWKHLRNRGRRATRGAGDPLRA